MRRGHDRASAPLAAASGSPPEPPWTDPLSDVLRTVRLTGAWFFLVEATSPWWSEVGEGVAIAPAVLPGAQHLVSYHVVTQGRCWAGLADGTEAWLETGDVVVFPHGDAYAMSTAPGRVGGQPVEAVEAALEFFRQLAAGTLPLRLTEGGGGPERVHAVCGFLGCDVAPFNPILAALPRLLHVRRPRTPAGGPAGDRLAALLDLALAEWGDRQAGSDCVLLRISEVRFVEVVRRHLAGLGPEQTGWLAGLRDPVVGRALRLLHQGPARPWTVETLSREAGVSSVAFDVGYESEAAFSRAFKKAVGIPPAAWRDRQAGGLRTG